MLEPREIAFSYLYQCEIEKLYFFSEGYWQSFLESSEVKSPDAAHSRALAKAVLSHYTEWTRLINEVSYKWPIHRMPLLDAIIIRLGISEFFLKKAPQKVVINEAVELAKKYGTEDSYKFVNAILDKIRPLFQS